MEKYKIEDVAKMCGLTKRTLRYYEEIGLLPPPERSKGGMRLYSRAHIDRLKRLINARDVLGFSLQDLQSYVSINEQLEAYVQGYRQTDDEAEKREKLLEMESVGRDQLRIIDEKLEKITQLRNETEQFLIRVQHALARFGEPRKSAEEHRGDTKISARDGDGKDGEDRKTQPE